MMDWFEHLADFMEWIETKIKKYNFYFKINKILKLLNAKRLTCDSVHDEFILWSVQYSLTLDRTWSVIGSASSYGQVTLCVANKFWVYSYKN